MEELMEGAQGQYYRKTFEGRGGGGIKSSLGSGWAVRDKRLEDKKSKEVRVGGIDQRGRDGTR